MLETKDKKGNKQYVNDPLEVAKHYAEPWRKQWRADDPRFKLEIGPNFRKLRTAYLQEAKETAEHLDTKATAIRKALRMFPGTTAIGADDFHFRMLADLPDNHANNLA